MRVLVTGATGFIGTALCDRLCREGHEVAAFHRQTSYISRISGLPLTRLTGDLTDAESVEQAVSSFRPEVIYHLGAQMTAAPTVSRIMQVNVLGTRYVLLSALKNRAERVILMSSACTLGMPELFRKYNQPPVVMNEARVRNAELPLWPFAESKNSGNGSTIRSDRRPGCRDRQSVPGHRTRRLVPPEKFRAHTAAGSSAGRCAERRAECDPDR